MTAWCSILKSRVINPLTNHYARERFGKGLTILAPAHWLGRGRGGFDIFQSSLLLLQDWGVRGLECTDLQDSLRRSPFNDLIFIMLRPSARPSHHSSTKNPTTLHYNYLVKCLNLVLVREDTGLGFTATQCLKPPSRKLSPFIPFRLLKRMTLKSDN